MPRPTTRRKDIDLARVRQAVEAAEGSTSAELVVSIAPFFLGRVWTAARRASSRTTPGWAMAVVGGDRLDSAIVASLIAAAASVLVVLGDGAAERLAWIECEDQEVLEHGHACGSSKAIGLWYEDFRQVSHEEVARILERAARQADAAS